MGATRRNNRNQHKQAEYGHILFVGILALIVDISLALVAWLAIGGRAGAIYYQMVFLPLAAFVVAFFALVRTRKMLLGMIIPLVVHLLLHWIVVGLSMAVILWMLLYAFSGFIGLAIGYIVVTHRD